MMNPVSTKAKNEITRKIKIYQMKERSMPNFVRKKREEMLSKVNIIFISLQRPLDTIIQPAPISTQRSADLRV
jgi:hypothetical protein